MDESQALIGAQVELTAPDGRTYRFRVASLSIYAGATYAVLERADAREQLLVTHIETDAHGAPVFVVAEAEDIISAVMEKHLFQTISRAMAQDNSCDEG